MKRSLVMLGALSSVAFATAAAADPPPAGDWNGVYVGVNGGGNWAHNRSNSSTTVNQLTGVDAGAGAVTAPSTTLPSGHRENGSGFMGGGQLGFNIQNGPFVWGAEGDFDGLTGRGRDFGGATLPATGLTTTSTVTAAHQSDPQWEATIRGRVGWAVHRALFYGTGGVAFVNVRERSFYTYTPTVTPAVTTANPAATFGPYANGGGFNGTHTGWTAGGGVEFLVSPNMTLGAEYRHTQVSYDYATGSNGPNGVSERGHTDFNDDAVLGRLNFKFGNNGHWW